MIDPLLNNSELKDHPDYRALYQENCDLIARITMLGLKEKSLEKMLLETERTWEEQPKTKELIASSAKNTLDYYDEVVIYENKIAKLTRELKRERTKNIILFIFFILTLACLLFKQFGGLT